MKIKAIVCDLEGVLLNIDYSAVFNSFQRYRKGPPIKYSGKFKELCEQYDKGSITTDKMFEEFKDLYQWPDLTYINFTSAWNSMLLTISDDKFEYLMHLKNQGIKLVLLSNINQLHAENVLNTYRIPLYRLFDKVIFSYKVNALKPSPQAFNLALKFLGKAGINAAEILFVDDSIENINAAMEQQMQTVTYPLNGKAKDGAPLSFSHYVGSFFNSISRSDKVDTNLATLAPS